MPQSDLAGVAGTRLLAAIRPPLCGGIAGRESGHLRGSVVQRLSPVTGSDMVSVTGSFLIRDVDRGVNLSWYLAVLRKYAVFQGRARRMEYWYFFLFNLIFTVILTIVDMAAGLFDDDLGFGVLLGLYTLAVFLPSFAVTVRRLHDTNRSGLWILIGLIPIVGAIWLLILLVLDSQLETNRFGDNPKLADA